VQRYSFPVKKGDRTPLGVFVARNGRFSPDEARELVRFGAVWVDGDRETDETRILRGGEQVTVHVPRHGVRRHYEADPARILFQDPWLLAYDKEAGVPCQSTPYDGYNNVCEALRRWLACGRPGAAGADPLAAREAGRGQAIPALHHRLDQAVSGVMLFALASRANGPLFRAFRDRQVEKDYRAVVCGEPAEDAWVETASVGRRDGRYLCVEAGCGKEAETRFRVLKRAPGLALVEARPRTGRTHQIRLHLALRGLPILGDILYGGRPHARCMLHARALALRHPVTSEPLEIQAPVPDLFHEALGAGPRSKA